MGIGKKHAILRIFDYVAFVFAVACIVLISGFNSEAQEHRNGKIAGPLSLLLSTPNFTIDELIPKGLDALSSGDILAAKRYFAQAESLAGSESSNIVDTTRFFYAYTYILALGYDRLSNNTNDGLNNLGDILDAFGISSSDEVRKDVTAFPIPSPFPSNSPTGAELQSFLKNKTLPELIKAQSVLNKVSNGFGKTWTEPLHQEAVESDYGDVLFFKAALNGALSSIHAQMAYNLNCDLDTKANTKSSIQQFLARETTFLTLAGSPATHLAQSKGYATAALNDLQSAIVWIEAETDDQGDDYVSLADLEPQEIVQAKLDIADAKKALNGPTLVADNKAGSTKSFMLDLSLFFAGMDLRSKLPSFSGDYVSGLFPDPTVGGIIGAGLSLNKDENNDQIPDILVEYGINHLPFSEWP